jgi:hypothetical protein
MVVSPNTIKIKRGKFSRVIYSGSDPYELKFFTDIKRLGVGSNVVAGDYKVDTFVETLNAGESSCSITIQLSPTISHITVVRHNPNEQNFTFLPPGNYSQMYYWYEYTKPTMGSCTITYNRAGQAQDYPEVVTFLVERG